MRQRTFSLYVGRKPAKLNGDIAFLGMRDPCDLQSDYMSAMEQHEMSGCQVMEDIRHDRGRMRDVYGKTRRLP